jgi:hypothetical protein
MTVYEYNYAGTGNYDTRPGTLSSLGFNEVIHFEAYEHGTGSFRAAFQANNGNLYTYDSSAGPAAYNLPMASGTSPSITAVSGGYENAYQATTHNLVVYGDSKKADTGQGMMPGTSPSIAAPAGSSSFEVAFQANNGNLYTYNSSTGPAAYSLPMESGTSPSIAALSNGGYEIAYQANSGVLVVYGAAAKGNTGMPMKAGTNPAIAPLPNGGYEVAYQSDTGELVDWGTGQKYNTTQGMMPGTSPSIAESSNGSFRDAFQANNGNLYTYDPSSGPAAYSLPMDPGSSPSITAVSSGYEMAYQSSGHELIVYGDSKKYNTTQGMMPGTSPSIG